MNRPVRFAILGLGAIAKAVMAPALSVVEGVEPYACAARDLDRAKAFAEEFGFKKYYGSYEEMLKDPDIDIVYISVPHALHCKYALMCMDAGKNVMVEKPFAANSAQAKLMFEKAKEKDVFCAEGIWSRYRPVALQLREICDSGIIGEVGGLTGEIGLHLSQERLFDPEMAGGALLDIGVYTCSLAGIVFGQDVVKVTADAAMTDRGVDETTSFTFRYAGGKVASLMVSMKYMSGGHATIWGTDGYIEINDTNFLDKAVVYDSDKNVIKTIENPEFKNLYGAEIECISNALAAGLKCAPENTAEETLKRIELMDTIRREIGLVYPFD